MKKAAEAAAKPPSKKAALLDDSAEETDPTLYFENRVKAINAKKAKGLNPYPHKFNVTMSLPDYVAKYKDLEDGSRLDDVVVAVAGAGVTQQQQQQLFQQQRLSTAVSANVSWGGGGTGQCL